MKLSENFTLEEFSRSEKAKELNIKNEPNPEQIENLRRLVVRLLQPLREKYGPLTVSSGFRCLRLNKAVGGVDSSQHTKGQAADIKVDNPRKLLTTLLGSGLMFDQAILYDDGRNLFLHISYDSSRNRKEVLYSKGTRP